MTTPWKPGDFLDHGYSTYHVDHAEPNPSPMSAGLDSWCYDLTDCDNGKYYKAVTIGPRGITRMTNLPEAFRKAPAPEIIHRPPLVRKGNKFVRGKVK